MAVSLNQRSAMCSPTMNFREGIGLVLAIVGAALVPLGWIVSAKVYLIAFVIFCVGASLLYTDRRLKRALEIQKEDFGRGSSGPEVPVDIYNYTGWRSGGRRQDMESISESGGADGD